VALGCGRGYWHLRIEPLHDAKACDESPLVCVDPRERTGPCHGRDARQPRIRIDIPCVVEPYLDLPTDIGICPQREHAILSPGDHL